jgi:hypothetical protein
MARWWPWILVGCSWVVVPAAAVLLRKIEPSNTNVGHLLAYLAAPLERADTDSWRPMTMATEVLRSREQGSPSLYELIFFSGKEKFQYPPTSLALLLVLQRFLAPAEVFSVLNALAWVAVLLTVIASVAVASAKPDGGKPVQVAADGFLALGMIGLGFYPLLYGQSLGQIQTFLTAAVAVALAANPARRPALCGALIGCCMAVKPQFAVALLVAIAARDWRFVAGVLATALLCLGLVLPWIQWADLTDYLRVMAFLSERSEAFYPNQSIVGVVIRYLGVGDPLVFSSKSFPPAVQEVAFVSRLVSVVFVAIAVLASRHRPAAERLAISVVAATLASPIAWEHHHGVLLPIWALVLQCQWHAATPVRLTVLSAIVVIGSQALVPLHDLSGDLTRGLLQVPLLWATLATLGLLLWVPRTAARDGVRL